MSPKVIGIRMRVHGKIRVVSKRQEISPYPPLPPSRHSHRIHCQWCRDAAPQVAGSTPSTNNVNAKNACSHRLRAVYLFSTVVGWTHTPSSYGTAIVTNIQAYHGHNLKHSSRCDATQHGPREWADARQGACRRAHPDPDRSVALKTRLVTAMSHDALVVGPQDTSQ